MIQQGVSEASRRFITEHVESLRDANAIDRSLYKTYDVRRGLRNPDGTGLTVGITNIGNVRGYYMQDGERVPMPGQLIYRGYDLSDLCRGFLSENRFGFEEVAYLLLFGELPDSKALESFKNILAEYRSLPDGFTEDMILAAPSKDIMNKLARSVLAMYSYDPEPDTDYSDMEKELDQAMHLIARCPVIVANAFAAKRHYFDDESLYIHRPKDDLSTSENFLYSVRRDNNFTHEEAQLLDLCLVVHAEHGGGNNSAFACRVLSSSGTDIYSSIAAAVGALKGPRHGGANKKVMEMFGYIERDVRDWTDENEVAEYLRKILRKEAGCGDGLIYGMGHAIYTMSDPRAVRLKKLAKSLAETKGMTDEFELIETVERLTPGVFAEITKSDKPMCANVDMYSGFVYKMLGIPDELYTPLFAIARMTGWCSHRLEETFSNNRIMRPAYKAVCSQRKYAPITDR